MSSFVANGCARRAASEEAHRVARSIELLRGAPNDEKAPLLRALMNERCSAPDVCALKALCARAYELHVRAIDSRRAIHHGLAAGAAPPSSARALLERAEDDLLRARDAAQRCVTEEAKLRVRYGI